MKVFSDEMQTTTTSNFIMLLWERRRTESGATEPCTIRMQDTADGTKCSTFCTVY